MGDGAGDSDGLGSGQIGPETLRLSGSPQRLMQAVQGLAEMAAQLDRIARRLQDSAGDARDSEAREVARAMSRDAGALCDLSEALDHGADVLRDAQSGTMPELRSRWHAARADLAEATGPPPTAGLDDDVVEDGPLREATRRYRRAVRSVLEDCDEAVLRVQLADQRVDDCLIRSEPATADVPTDGSAVTLERGETTTPGPSDARRFGADLADGVDTLRGMGQWLDAVRESMDAGRVSPADERVGSHDRFHRVWTEHFQGLVGTIEQVRRRDREGR